LRRRLSGPGPGGKVTRRRFWPRTRGPRVPGPVGSFRATRVTPT
jgi:hypothetical protein